MRRWILKAASLLAFLALASCSGKEDDLASCPVERTPIERSSLCLPLGWNARTEQFGTEGNFLVLVHPANSTGSLMQIHVKKDPLQEVVRSSLSFAERAVEITRGRAPNYKAVRTEPMTIGREETILHIFDASPEEGEGSVRYYQFVTTNAGIAYGFTAVMHPAVDDALREDLTGILTSVRFE